MIAGRISEQNFNTMLEKTQTEQTELKTKVSEGRKRLSDEVQLANDAKQWVEAIQEYANITELSADYEAEQKELKERAARLREELSKAQEATANAEKFMNVVRRHTTIEELTPTLLREFVEKIVVHESVALDGKRRGKLRRQEIEIYYSFVGKVELPDT